jgi:hypothetical protein
MAPKMTVNIRRLRLMRDLPSQTPRFGSSVLSGRKFRTMSETPTRTRVRAMIVIMMFLTVSASKEPSIHSRVATPRSPAGMLPRPRKIATSRFTDCWR